MAVRMGLFRRRRISLEPLAVDHLDNHHATAAQDNAPGPGPLDIEATEHAEAMREANRTVRSPALFGIGDSSEQQLDPGSNGPRLMPRHDSTDDWTLSEEC